MTAFQSSPIDAPMTRLAITSQCIVCVCYPVLASSYTACVSLIIYQFGLFLSHYLCESLSSGPIEAYIRFAGLCAVQ